MYKKVELKNGFVGMENKVAEMWKQKNIIKKNFDMNKGKRYFTFYDGPPTANGKPHVGHIETRVMKDIIPRYKVMKGYHVDRKAGWDTHGLPVELEIEKKLGISGKEQIEEYGVEKFVKECKESVFTYVHMWEEMTNKVGYWVDMENPYVTYHNDYIESVWWALKEMWKKGLLYEGHKVMPYCPRCGTALSSHEVAQGYKDVKDLTCIAKFKVVGEDKYILAWTTTPWTLPSNLALCVNKAYTYVEVKANIGTDDEPKYENYILAKDLLTNVLKETPYEIVKEFKGTELLGTKYEQLMPFAKVDGKAFEVIHGDYVTIEDGTGIVHIAPAYGEDDSLVAKQNGIAFVNLVDKSGKFVPEVEPWAGRFVRDCNEDICKWLADEGKLFSKEKHIHSYPHCWRCDTPLLYYPKESWFVAMTKLRDELVANNNKINWYPDTIRTGRFGKFLENVIDWGISRDRYWGTPLPVWKCECGHEECIGSIAELKEKAIDCPDEIELHKPYIDNVHLKCPECGKTMTRFKEVIDCWFDSGSMPFAQLHYPFENKEEFEKHFPAQFISEAIDQTRGWFYTLLAVSTCLFDKPSYENCIVLGHVLDEKGQKMSKSKKNGVDLVYVNTRDIADVNKELRKYSEKGFDDVFIFAPNEEMVTYGVKMLAFDGCLNFFSGPADQEFSSRVNFYNIHYNSTHFVGTSGGNTEDMKQSIELIENKTVNVAKIATHILGLDHAVETTKALPELEGSKKIVYTHKKFPLTEVDKFDENSDDKYIRELKSIVERNGNLWSGEAERYFIQNAPEI